MAAKKCCKAKEEQSEVKKPASKKKTASKGSSQSNKGKGMGFIKKLLYVVMALIIMLLSVIIYVMINFDTYKTKIADKIALNLEKVSLDVNNLTDKQTKLKLHFNVNQSLPADVVFKCLNFDLTLGDYQVAKQMQAEVMASIKQNTDTKITIGVNVDSIQARRAIAKGIEKNASKLLKTVLAKKSVTKEIGEDIKAITVLMGTADFMIKAGPLEIPFNKKISF